MRRSKTSRRHGTGRRRTSGHHKGKRRAAGRGQRRNGPEI
jgi:hypothetical protein